MIHKCSSMTPSKLDEVGQYTLKKNNPKVESLIGIWEVPGAKEEGFQWEQGFVGFQLAALNVNGSSYVCSEEMQASQKMEIWSSYVLHYDNFIVGK